MTLCVVDMQPHFKPARKDSLVKNVISEIRKAKRKREGIVVLEYATLGFSDSDIIEEVKSYDRQTIVTKHEDDGSEEFMNAVHQHKFWPMRLKFCGVNACYCVWDTFWGVYHSTSKNTKLELLSHAVNCSCPNRGGKLKQCIGWYKEQAADCERVKILNG